MKKLILIALCLSLTACLSGGGSGAQIGEVTIVDELLPPETEEPGPDPAPASLTAAILSGKTLSQVSSQISISNDLTIISDSYCGHSFKISSITQVDASTIKIESTGQSQGSPLYPVPYLAADSSYTFPGHYNCFIDVSSIDWYYPESGANSMIYFSAVDGVGKVEVAFYVSYTISLVNSTYVVDRELKTRPYRRSTSTASGVYVRVQGSKLIEDMNHNLL